MERREEENGPVGFTIVFRWSAAKDFEALPRVIQQRFAKAFASMLMEPYPRPGLDVRPLVGSPEVWRLRVGSYRGVYIVDGRTIRFTRFGHRSKVYR